ncbi:hypothetical protein FJ960_01930 [Mesorhizobium sp. B2-3-11]|uniref:hypothetical protein n=1 Tax=Mesorhizobium sp. B2-3-11 TaxID=2589953 RepID=UPI001125DB9B|nr:hypothetical protein [Mesorhizobium sp. B2-3-11]TPM11526.1 hypothetical protein FJ960_01930 [Mesorhizobium sp. B2-3-11]
MAKTLKIIHAADRIIEGTASSTARNHGDGERLDPAGVTLTNDFVPLYLSHDKSRQVGQVLELQPKGQRLRFKARVDDAEVFAEIERGEWPTCSVGSKTVRAERLSDNSYIAREWQITEISLAKKWTNANPDAEVDAVYSEERSSEVELAESPPAVDVTRRLADGAVKIEPPGWKAGDPIFVPGLDAPAPPPLPVYKKPPGSPVRIARRARKRGDPILVPGLAGPGEADAGRDKAISPDKAKAAEISRVADRIKEIDAAVKKLERRAYYKFKDGQLINAINAATDKLARERATLTEREVGLETGLIDMQKEAAAKVEARQQKAMPAAPARQFPVQVLPPEPAYPSGARKAGDSQRIEDAREAFDTYYEIKLMNDLAASGISPDATVSIELLAVMRSQALSAMYWEAKRFSELEDRVRELESNALGYSGIFDETKTYHPNEFCTYAGSLWAATMVTKGVKPGDGAVWRLAVKRGG